MDGRKVPDYMGEFHLPITTHRPHKYAVVDLEDGNIWVQDPAATPDRVKPIHASDKDIALIKKICKMEKNKE